MDQASIVDLEAELGCFEPGLPNAAPRRGHGSSNIFFDAPTGTTSRLKPPSKTKSVYHFGEDGTLGWATPAGELLSVASCIGNRLVGIEYKQSIERGQDYHRRGEMLERVAKVSQGSGYGIGLSLDVKIHPSEVFWVHNRWPRYIYQHGGLEIRLQYYIKSQSVIQQYQIRNNGQEDALLPFVISSDVSFREHQRPSGTIQPIPSAKCPERFLLVQNSAVLIRNSKYEAQSEMAVFLNGERQSLWAEKPRSDNEEDAVENDDTGEIVETMKGAEETIQNTINSNQILSKLATYRFMYLYSRYYGRQNKSQTNEQSNFAIYRNNIVVPRGSTQELSAVIQISGFHGSEPAPQDPAPSGNPESNQNFGPDEEELAMEDIWERKERLIAGAKYFPLNKSDSGSKRRISEIVKEHVGLGEACSKVQWIGDARYHYHMAYLIAEAFRKDNRDMWNNARFDYARFLDDHGWHRTALSIVNGLVSDLFSEGSWDVDITDLWTVIINRAGSILLRNRSFMEAKMLYETGLNHFSKNGTEFNTDSAHFLERVALTQVYQEHNQEAHENYTRLLNYPSSARQTILNNLGFIERRLGQLSEAKAHYECSLKVSRGGTDDILALSGLHTCLRELHTDPEEFADVWASYIRYVDVNSALSLWTSPNSPFTGGPFSFAIARHLESLLSVCSIPTKGDQGSSGIALLDADPLNCLYTGRTAYFQFRFLIQCQRYIRSMRKDEDAERHFEERIHSVCKGHLVWVFQIANSETINTWSPYYTVSGSNTAEELKASSIKSSLAYSVEGAFQFLKLCLYLSTWNEEWQFILELLDLKLDHWLSYLTSNKHMANLWVEDEDVESFKPYNSTSEDVSHIRRTYPHYHLSDAALVWLALLYVEKMVQFIEDKFHTQTPQNAESIERKVKDVRQTFDASQGTLSLQQIRSSILETFKVPKRGLSSSTSALLGSQTTEAWSSVQAKAAEKRDQQVIAFQRTINESLLEIGPYDFATIEASILGIFEGSGDHAEAAWRETLKMQKGKDISTFEDPRQIALSMFASKFPTRFKYDLASSRAGKIEDAWTNRLQDALYDSGLFAQKIVEDAPEPMSEWRALTYETMSLLVGGLFKECREMFLVHTRQEPAEPIRNALALLMTQSRSLTRTPVSILNTVNPSSGMDQMDIVNTDFLPDWMYFYPDFIHREELKINVREKLHQLSSVKSLAPAITMWKASENFDTGEETNIPFAAGLVDSGIKKRTSPHQTLPEREISVSGYYDPKMFWKRLLQPRTAEKAKKRLIELSSQDKESVLICWLTTSEEERHFFLEYFRRHESSESFFGERAHLRANVWETEFHLGFYELLSAEGDEESRTVAEIVDEDPQSQLLGRQIYSQPVSPDRHEVKPVALSFRFVGDLRDRFWTCYFFSSVNHGFDGFVDEYYRFSGTEDRLHAETQGQRKVLELSYVDKALGEMRRSIDKILTAFDKDLDAPEAKDPANESFIFIHDSSSLYLEIEGKLRIVSQQLDNSLSTIEQWEKREEARGLRSRWSRKDEERHGGKLRDLTLKCKFTVQQLRTQQGRLREQRRIANQRHSNLVSYKQLQEARTSTHQAADVRLFTYVTIIFLPLSFSSSLFSMAGAPKSSTIYSMVPTTAIALMLTFLLIANLKLMDRRWSFWVNRMNARTREKMKASEQSQKWKDISRQLEHTTHLRLIKSDFEQGLPAESNWWYFRFWLSYTAQWMRALAHKGVRTWEAYGKMPMKRPHEILAALFLAMMCAMIFIIYTAILMVVDTIHLQWIMILRLSRHMLSSESKDQPLKNDGAADGEGNVKITTKATGFKKRGRLAIVIKYFIAWLESPPRPIRNYIRKMESAPTDTTTLDDEATESQHNIMRTFLAKVLPRWRTYSSSEHDKKKDSTAADGV